MGILAYVGLIGIGLAELVLGRRDKQLERDYQILSEEYQQEQLYKDFRDS